MEQDALSDFMSFRTLISTTWIKVVYAVGAVFITIGSVVAFVLLAQADQAGVGIMLGLLYLVGGNIVWRMACEFVILFFSMHEQLVKLVRLSAGRMAPIAAASASSATPVISQRANAPSDSIQGVPALVSESYDRWVGGDADAYHDFVRHLESAFDIMPARITTEFLRNRYRAAAGTPEFESALARRDS